MWWNNKSEMGKLMARRRHLKDQKSDQYLDCVILAIMSYENRSIVYLRLSYILF